MKCANCVYFLGLTHYQASEELHARALTSLNASHTMFPKVLNSLWFYVGGVLMMRRNLIGLVFV